jgi:hypothetical protein
MNRAMQEKWPWIDGAHSLRAQLLDLLTDADLAFVPGGGNIPLGALLREWGEVEYSYLQSLKTFQQDWSYRNREAGLESDLTRIKAWYHSLGEEMQATLAAFSDDDLSKTIDPRGFTVELQLDVYLQALLIFSGKASVYFKAMNRALPPSFLEYIG